MSCDHNPKQNNCYATYILAIQKGFRTTFACWKKCQWLTCWKNNNNNQALFLPVFSIIDFQSFYLYYSVQGCGGSRWSTNKLKVHICKWVNSEQIFFWYKLLRTKYYWSSTVCKILAFKVNFLCLKLFEYFYFFHCRVSF